MYPLCYANNGTRLKTETQIWVDNVFICKIKPLKKTKKKKTKVPEVDLRRGR